MSFSREAFDEMIERLDKDKDGTVDKEEFYSEYCQMFPDIGPMDSDDPEGFSVKVWAKMDVDGDGALTVEELANYYGFDLSNNQANDMSDEQILEALALQAQLDALNIDAEKRKAEAEAKENSKVGRVTDKSIKMIMTNKPELVQGQPVEEAQLTFLQCCKIQDFTEKHSRDPDKINAFMFVGDPKAGDYYADKDIETPMRHEGGPIDVRCMDENGEMALHHLARRWDEKGQVKALFDRLIKVMREQATAAGRSDKYGPTIVGDVNHQNKEGKTPLYCAVESKNEPMVDLLFGLGRDGPDPLLQNGAGWTIMHAAVFTDHMPILKHLAQKFTPGRTRALLMMADKSNREPLHIAAYKCSPEMNGFLVDLGANDSRQDSAGKTPTALADSCFQNTGKKERRESKEIIEDKLLKREGGRSNSKELPGSGSASRRASREM